MKTSTLASLLLGLTAFGASAHAAGTYTLTKVTFSGNAQVPTTELQAALPIQPGQSIDSDGVQQETDAVGEIYKKHNVGASLSARFTVTKNKYATIAYTLAEQAPVAPTVTHVGITVDHVTATGNKQVATADIIAASAIKPGDTVTNEKIAAAQAAIVALYKKKNVGFTISTDWTNTQPQHVDMVFKIVEK